MQEAFFRSVLCGVLVCVSAWMTMAGCSYRRRFIAVAEAPHRPQLAPEESTHPGQS